MDGPGQATFAFPRPGKALWAVLILVGGLGIVMALLANWTPIGARLFGFLVCDVHDVFPQAWRLVTSGLLTNPQSLQHLIFSLIGLYFLGPTLEARWGARRFILFLAISVVLGNLLVLAVSAVTPITADPAFHPSKLFGPYAAISAIAVAWSRENSEVQARFFFLIPVKGKYLLWITIGFCVLGLVFYEQIPEGMVAPFGGVIAGMLFSGNPSVFRTLYLRGRLFFLRRRKASLRVDDVLAAPRPVMPKRSRAGAPPLRVVQGGLDEVLKNRKPPKDKRYLN